MTASHRYNGQLTQASMSDAELDTFDLTPQVVDPDVRAHVYSLVTAVSGSFHRRDARLMMVAGRVQWRRCGSIYAG